MKKILVPTDFSKASLIALEVASDIAKKAEARLIILHVIEQPGQESFNVTGEAEAEESWEDKVFTLKLVNKQKGQLEKISEDLKNDGVKVTTLLRLGNAYHGISTIITEQNVDLIVMGTSGHTKLEEMIIGSNTEKVIRNSECPVLTVHAKPTRTDYKNIVYATSMSDDEKEFSRLVKNTQKLYDSTVHVVRINTPNNFQPDTIVERVMVNFVKKIKLENFTLNVFNHYSEEEGIIHFADSIDADLIVMATHGRKGFAHVLAGSIAEDVANHSKRPVLTYITR